jgi:hypothetical protein
MTAYGLSCPLRGVSANALPSKIVNDFVEQGGARLPMTQTKNPPDGGIFLFGTNEWTRTTDPHHVKVVL